MTYTDEQIAEALRSTDAMEKYYDKHPDFAPPSVNEMRAIVLASALRSAQERIKQMESVDVCEWHETECYWQSSCGLEWALNDGSPIDNGMLYCPKCGKHLTEAESAEEEER